MSQAIEIIVTASLTAAACALLGTFLVLRKMALIGDAISHSVLPGIAVAFFLTHSLGPLPMLVGASLFGLATAGLIEALYRTRRIQEDASMGVVFPALFALGVLLITRFAGQVHIDTECVLYGEIAYVPLDRLVVAGRDIGPRGAWVLGVVTFLNLAFVVGFWKELKIGTFDPELASALGLAPAVVQYLLMGAVSMTTVAAFESVGAILVVAMLIVPPATAYLLTDRLWLLVALAVLIGAVAAASGYLLARWFDLSPAGGMAAMCGAFFTVAWLFAPRHGVVARWIAQSRRRLRFSGELVLTHLVDQPGTATTERDIAARFRWTERFGGRVLAALERKRLLRRDGATFSLTEAGHVARRSLPSRPSRRA